MLHRFLLVFLVLCFTANSLAEQTLNRIVASVNNDVVMESELRNRSAMVISQLRAQQAELPSGTALQKQVLDRLILENLQLQLAERNGIRVDDDKLNNSMRKLAKQNGMSLSEFRSALEQDGYDYVAFREQFRNQITINQIRQQMVENRVEVTEQEVDNLLATATSLSDQNREYHLAHILISTPEAASPEQIKEARKRADDILARLRQGTNFEQMAIAESDGRQALSGGDLGWRKADQLPSLFTDVVGELQVGQISDPIRSPSGFHIVKVLDIRGDQRRLIKQTHARHILLQPDTLVSEQEIKTRMDQLRERIAQGEDFAVLARAHSQDPGSGSQGGDLGWITPGQMVPEFEQVMDELEIQEVSQPVQSRFGWHLIQVLDRREQDETDEYRRNRARESIRQRKTDEQLEIWLRRLRDEAYVEYHIDE